MPTLAELRTQIRQRADMEHSEFISDAELDAWIGASLHELYGLLVQSFGDNYYVADPHEFSTDGSTSYALPDDCFKLLGVDLYQGGRWRSLRPFNFAERNRRHLVSTPRYQLRGNRIALEPAASGQQLRLWYVPRLDVPTEDEDTVDGVNGWEEYVVVDCVIKAHQKEESDPSVAMAQKAALVRRIESEAANRDAGTPMRVSDVTGGFSGYGADPYADWEP